MSNRSNGLLLLVFRKNPQEWFKLITKRGLGILKTSNSSFQKKKTTEKGEILRKDPLKICQKRTRRVNREIVGENFKIWENIEREKQTFLLKSLKRKIYDFNKKLVEFKTLSQI